MEMKRKLTSDKMDFKIKTVVRDKEEYCVMIMLMLWYVKDNVNLKRGMKFVNIGPTKCIKQIGEKLTVKQE